MCVPVSSFPQQRGFVGTMVKAIDELLSSGTAAGRGLDRLPPPILTVRTGPPPRRALTDAGEDVEDRAEQVEAVGTGTGERVDRVLRVGHEADHAAVG